MLYLRSVAAVAAFLLVALSSPALPQDAPRQDLVVATDDGAHAFRVEIADDARERARGLMFRRSMSDDEGMLFDFGGTQPVSFWMRNTYISLDLLFITADGTIASIAERATPLSEKSIPSRTPVRYVLEINGGLSDRLGIESGDMVSGPAMQGPE